MQQFVTKSIRLGGKFYSKGEYDFSDEQMKAHDFLFFKKVGRILDQPEVKQVEIDPAAEALKAEMVAKYGIKKAAPKADVIEPEKPVKKSKK